MNLDVILLIVGSVVMAFGLGVGVALLSDKVRVSLLKRKAEKVIMGKEKNLIVVDGEKINVNKFKYKDYDGKIQYVTIGENQEVREIPKKPKKAL